MNTQRQHKVDSVAELKDSLSKAASVVLADFRGLSVLEVNGLRSEMRKNDCTYRVVKNTLVKLAVADTPMAGLAEFLNGPTAIAYSFEDPIAPAKILDQFAGDLKNLEVKAGFMEGEVLDVAGVASLAKMKGKDELRAEFLALLQAPAQNFVALTNAVAVNILYLLGARERNLSEG